MPILAPALDPTVQDVRFTEDRLEVQLRDGRRVSVPLAWYPRLQAASSEDRACWEACAAGLGIHWPTLDEDLSVEGLLRYASTSS